MNFIVAMMVVQGAWCVDGHPVERSLYWRTTLQINTGPVVEVQDGVVTSPVQVIPASIERPFPILRSWSEALLTLVDGSQLRLIRSKEVSC